MNILTQLIPTLISLIAVIISIITLYITSLNPPKISLSVGESMQIWHNTDESHALNIDLPIVFYNAGAKSGVVSSLALIIKDPNSEESILIKWIGTKNFEDSKLIFESQRLPIAVPANGEIAHIVSFAGKHQNLNWIPKPITYNLYLLGWTKDSENPAINYKFAWTFSDNDVLDIKKWYDEAKSRGQWFYSSGYALDSRKLNTFELNNLIKN